jgi:hypothetical protein
LKRTKRGLLEVGLESATKMRYCGVVSGGVKGAGSLLLSLVANHVRCVFSTTRQSVWWQVFAVQMVCTGVLACVLFPIGLSPRENKMHHIAALAYMLNHIPMLYYWRIVRTHSAP